MMRFAVKLLLRQIYDVVQVGPSCPSKFTKNTRASLGHDCLFLVPEDVNGTTRKTCIMQWNFTPNNHMLLLTTSIPLAKTKILKPENS